ncbi:MAG: o-succinylbenzoate synthase [Pyrinomonadaceae bacterium]|nr:o-succinylbenzoate synthase [Pyrinomonadaceae bacterium]
MQLEKIELFEIEMPLKDSFETSFGTTHNRRILLLKVWNKDGVTGWSECTAPLHPFYLHETIDTCWSIIKDFAVPMLAKAKVSCACEVSKVLAPIQGNRMAIGAVETALWDLEAKEKGIPLWHHLGGTQTEINCGVSIGIQSSLEKLVEVVTQEVESGYQRIKLKIKPGQDIELVKKIRSIYPDIFLSVDANSAYQFERDKEIFQELDDYNLLMIEQPLEAGDLIDHAKLQKLIQTKICLDESITRFRDARQAIEIDACRIINIKLGRVGGHVEAKKIQQFALENNVPVWCGGMLEAGIGRAHNIAMSTLAGFTLPGDVSASARYWKEDIIEPEVMVSSNGTIKAPSGAGIGFEIKESLIEKLTIKKESLSFNDL